MPTKRYKQLLLMIFYIAGLAAAVLHVKELWGLLVLFLSVLSPLFIGFGIAFVLNMPFAFLKKMLVRFGKTSRSRAALRTLSLVLTYVLVFALLGMIVAFMAPQLGESVSTLMRNIDGYARNAQQLVTDLAAKLNIESLDDVQVAKWITGIADNAGAVISGAIPQVVSFTSGVVWSVMNFVIGFIISFYILLDKKHLKAQCVRMLFSYLPYNKAQRMRSLTNLCSECCSQFISGQVFSSLVLGALCFGGMQIINYFFHPLSYIMLVSVVIGVTNCVPLVGPWLGAVPSLFILAMVDPAQALWFGVFLLILQIISQNLLAPHIMGSKIGLPGLWVIVAITVGGGLFGIGGMIVSIPLASVLYRLLRADTALRTENIRYANKQGPAPLDDKEAEAVVRRRPAQTEEE